MSAQYPSAWHPPPLTGLIDVRAHNFLLALGTKTVNIREIFLEWEDVAKLVTETCHIGAGRCYSRVHWDFPDDNHVPGLASLIRYLCSLGLNIPQEDRPPDEIWNCVKGQRGRSFLLPDLAVPLRGRRGVQGLRGRAGDAGLAGVDGARGPRGFVWHQGRRGLSASAFGEPGARGPRGLQGERGLQGRRGLSIAASEPGPRGARGLQGEQGLRGRRGVGLGPDSWPEEQEACRASRACGAGGA